MKYPLIVISIFLGTLCSTVANAQNPESIEKDSITMNALDIQDNDGLYKYILNSSIYLNWIDNGKAFYYQYDTKDEGDVFYLVTSNNWKKVQLFDNASMAKKLSKITGKEVEATHLKIYSLDFSKSLNTFTFNYDKKKLQYNRLTRRLKEIKVKKEESNKNSYLKRLSSHNDSWKSYSKDSLYYVYTYKHDIYLHKTDESDSVRLTYDGAKYYSFNSGYTASHDDTLRHRPSGRWALDSHKYFVIRKDERKVGTMTLVDNLAQPRPKPKTYKFPLPGDKNVTQYEAWLVDADAMAAKKVKMDKYKDQKLEIPRFNYDAVSSKYVFLYRRNRTCDILELCGIDINTGKVKVIIHDENKPHFNDQLISFKILNDGNDIIWWSERTGKGQYYLYDQEGNLKNTITPDDFVAGPITKIDTLGRSFIFEGYGREKGINPNYKFYYKTSFDKNDVTLLTPGNGEHDIKISPNGKYIQDTYSRMDSAPKFNICDMQGNVKLSLGHCDISDLLAKGWKYPKLITTLAGDSVTKLYSVMYEPYDIDTTKRYPIIANSYPGPHTDLMPWAFATDDNSNASLAQLGFVVVTTSLRGSNGRRGRDFHCYGYGNLRDYPLADQKGTIEQIAKKYNYIDLNKVGIYGHSGGGFMSAASILTYPDFYKVAVAASGNHDNNIYTQWWGETYNGIQEKTDSLGNISFDFKVKTNIELADRLKGKLLLITGDVDNNVHPASTFRLVNALIKANKQFDLMVIPGKDHGLGDDYYNNLIRYYFVKNLLNEPRDPHQLLHK